MSQVTAEVPIYYLMWLQNELTRQLAISLKMQCFNCFGVGYDDHLIEHRYIAATLAYYKVEGIIKYYAEAFAVERRLN